MSKLLNKPFKAFTIYALIVLACSIPVYYLVVDYIWMQELDEHNRVIKQRIEKRFYKVILQDKELASIIESWNVLQPGTTLIPDQSYTVKSDSVYTITHANTYSTEKEAERYRGLSAYIPINDNYYHLTVETNVEEVDETLLAIAFVTFLFFGLLITGFILLNRMIAGKIWLPFRITLNQLKKFDLQKDKSIEFQKTTIEEFEELNRELGKLIEKNISVFAQQKRFIENASHELQTPLAVLRSRIEMLLQNENLNEKQAEIISSINLTLARVSRINKNLLLIAKIENNQFMEIENFQIAEVLNENIELLSDYIQAKSIKISVEKKSNLSVSGNKTLLEVLLNNLLINAIIHISKQAEIHIVLSDKQLIFFNSGEAPLDKTMLFKRFARASSEKTNSGLGLAIAKEICDRYQWHLDYKYQNGLHSFSISF